MKTLHLSVIVTLIMSVIFLMIPHNAYASTCAYRETIYSTPQFFLLSDNVFVGTVSSISNYTDHQWKVHFTVEKIWKGMSSQKPSIVITNSLQGCGYAISMGEKYLVYTYDSPPFLNTSFTKLYADAQNDIALLDDPKFQAEEKIKEELNKKLEAAKGIIESMMISKISEIPFNSVGVDEINSILDVGIDNTKATLSAEEYQKKLKEILGDIPIKIEFGQISNLLPKNTTDNFIGNDLVPPVLTSPLKQFKSGIPAQAITCKQGLQSIMKINGGSPACVKPSTASRLIEIGWGEPTIIIEKGWIDRSK